MSASAHRTVLGLLVILAILAVAGRRLSDGTRRVPADAPPALWEPAEHERGKPGTQFGDGMVPAAGATNPALHCAIMISTRRGDPFVLTSIEDGVLFDIDADGDLEEVSWTESGSDVAFLAMDRDGDGRIISGRELIGDHSLLDVQSGLSVLTELAKDAAGGELLRAVVDSENPLFAKLVLWTDGNHNGISEPDEVRSAAEVLSGIGLGFEGHHRRDRHGNESRRRGFVHVRTAPGLNTPASAEEDVTRRRSLYDVCLISSQ